MVDKGTLIGLLIETIAHWDDNIESFKELGEEDSQDVWFTNNCYAGDCSLCRYKKENDIERCGDFCPLDDERDEDDGDYEDNLCCVEWSNLHDKIKGLEDGTATIEDVEAMRNRIQRELDKITGKSKREEPCKR